jgi:hypothetical protein
LSRSRSVDDSIPNENYIFINPNKVEKDNQQDPFVDDVSPAELPSKLFLITLF